MSEYESTEKYARYLRAKWMKVKNTRIHHKAFEFRISSNDENIKEISCYEIQGLSLVEIKQLHKLRKILFHGKEPIGHATIVESDNLPNKVNLKKDNSIIGHLNLVVSSKLEKHELKTISNQLAELFGRNIIMY